MRLVPCPAGAGSGEQWVREQFVIEVKAYRRRHAHTATALIVVVDADTLSVDERLAQLDQNLEATQTDRIRLDEQIATLVPKRNVETWILCLNDVSVDEETDYKRSRKDWETLVRSGSETLYHWTRPNAQPPPTCVPSLRLCVTSLARLDFRRS